MTDASTPSLLPCGAAPRGRTARPRPGRRRVAALSALGVAALAMAACGASSTASTTSSSSPAGGSGAGGGATQRQFPGASGTIAAINGDSLEVQNTSSGQTTVTYTSSTTFDQTVTSSASAVTVGACISAFGKPTSTSSSSKGGFGGPVTATTVSITPPTSGSCSTGLGGFGGRPAGGGTTGGAPSGGEIPGGGSGQRPGGGSGFSGRANGQFGAASGTVAAASGSTVTVTETNPTTKKTSSVVVTLLSSTTFTQRTVAASTDLAVGKCAQAQGAADSTGAVAARSITISTPGANGCTSGLGGFPGGRGAGGSGAEVPTGA
jgi:hypothetical protein